jgi:hypothetical protein
LAATAIIAGLLLTVTAAGTVFGRALESPPPAPGEQQALAKTGAYNRRIFDMRLHYAGNVWLALSNFAQYGTADAPSVNRKDLDMLKINYSPSMEFPAGTRNDYMFVGGFWFGGIVGNDTLVSRSVKGISTSGFDEINPFDSVTESSDIATSIYYDPLAKAEQQYFCRYSDTLILFSGDEIDGRGHLPVGVEVSQTSYVWSDSTTRNFIIIQMWIRNVSDHPISNFVLGIFQDADIWNDQQTTDGAADDISGFLTGAPNLNCPESRDSLNVAWVADNDGDPRGGQFPLGSTHGVIGIRFLSAPPNDGVSFNWWTLQNPEWGPAKVGSGDPVGAPTGDRRTYYMMANRTIDYGQVYSALDFSADGWRRPTAAQCGIAAGADTRQMISCGPLVEPIMPGDSVRFAFALLAGDNFHTDPTPEQFDCQNPGEFFAKKNFGELSEAAQWASWIYDTPGFDTDEDGYAGEFTLCGAETSLVWNPDSNRFIPVVTYQDTIPIVGDLGPPPGYGGSYESYNGSPDLALDQAPPPPTPGPEGDTTAELTFQTRPSKIIIRWSGRSSEIYKARISRKRLFEGFKLYTSRVNLVSQYSLLASWDRDNYRRYVWTEPLGEEGTWKTDGSVLPIELLRRETGNSAFDPNLYDEISCTSGDRCYFDTVIGLTGLPQERQSYFVPVGANRGNTYIENGMEITNLIQCDSVRDSVAATGDTLQWGYYHVEIDGMNPSVGQYIAVTAFDHGDLKSKRSSKESDPRKCTIFAVPVYSASVVEREGLHVAVYPNPYKIEYDAPGGYRTSYYAQGYEAPEKKGDPDAFLPTFRRVNFINLPDTATISIYTLDGDLVRTIHHPDKNLTSYSSKCSWDLVTRNTQAAVSGIYIYRIDSKLGSQVGKIVVIK